MILAGTSPTGLRVIYESERRMKKNMAEVTRLLLALSFFAGGGLLMGLASYPGVLLCFKIWFLTDSVHFNLRVLLLCVSSAAAYFLYGIVLILLSGLCRKVFRVNLTEGEHAMLSGDAVMWVFASALTAVVSKTFMAFMVATPLASLFYRMMGARVGRNVLINSGFCSDLSLLEIGDDSVIGGHATVIAHSVEKGRLILRKVKIGKRVTIGLNSVILPGVQIGDGAIIAAGAVVYKNTVVAPGSLYAGVPAAEVRAVEKKRSSQGLPHDAAVCHDS